MTTVALLTREFPPHVYGGAGVHVEHLAAALAEHVEVRVHRFAESDAPRAGETYGSWDALRGDAPHLAALRVMSTDLAMAAGVDGTDVAHSHTWYANFAGHLAKLLYGIPHVCTTHSLEPLRPWKAEQLAGGYALSSFCERTALEGADRIIAVSARMRDDILRCYPAVDPQRVAVVHNGIDVTTYAPDPARDVLDRHRIDPDRPMVVFVGRITRQKGLVHLLEAAEFMDAGAQLVLCAGAPDTVEIAGEVREHVERLRATREGVVWIEQLLPRPEIVQILSHATVFVCPSIYEPFGLVNVEAMACEAAVVASRTGGIPEIVLHGETGLLVDVDPGDDPYGTPRHPERFAHALAAAVNTLVADPDRARAFGRAGRQRVVDHFSWESIAARTAEIYASLVT
ncbi:MAG: glycogen synthase [Nitriliruptorales bacterium]|nr:glycogen synthase [Nitriliruptorales bacterium]